MTANKITFIKSNKASLFTKARLAMTDAGKKITYLNTHCEIILDAGQVVFRPISYFMKGKETKNGKSVEVDLSNVKGGDLVFVRKLLKELGFKTVNNIEMSTGKTDVAIPLDDAENLKLFNRYGQMFEFNRFSMKFQRLDKDGVAAVINKYSEFVRG